MIQTIVIAILFFVSLFFQTTVIQTFGLPIGATPFHLAMGFVLLHRGRMELGVAWLLLSPLLSMWIGFLPGTWWAYILIAALGPILVTRIFAKRSFLALTGLSWSLYTLFMLASLGTFPEAGWTFFWGLIMLTITLMLVAYVARYTLRFSKRFLLVRRTNIYGR